MIDPPPFFSSTLSPPAAEHIFIKIEITPDVEAPQPLDACPPTDFCVEDGPKDHPIALDMYFALVYLCLCCFISLMFSEGSRNPLEGAAPSVLATTLSPGALSIEAPSRMPVYMPMLKAGFVLLAKNIEPFLDGTPFKIPLTVLDVYIDLAHTVSGNLLEQTCHRLSVVNTALMEAKSDDAKEQIHKFIKLLLRETDGLDGMLQRRTWEKLIQSNHDIETIVDTVNRIDQCLKDFQIDVIMSVERNTEDMREQLNLLRMDSWPHSRHTKYGADIDSILLTREACTPNTRVSIPAHIKHWVEDPSFDCPPVFWLTGHAGSGKSTIAFSISQHYDLNSDLLATNFFCSGQFEDTRSRKYIIHSIVHQLARHSSSFRRALLAIHHFESPDEANKQMKALLVEPWKECMRRQQFPVPPLLVVIDALDEIEHGGGCIFLRDLLQVIDRGHLSGLRFLVTSRPDPAIVTLCATLEPKAVCRLQAVDMANVGENITTFLHAKLPALRDEPALGKLARRSNGLFHLRCHGCQKLLSPSAPSNSRNAFLIDELYKQILWAAFCNLEDAHFSTRLGLLHSILSDKISAPLHDISVINTTTQETVELVVNELHAVLYIKDGLICWYHTSFPDFIFDYQRSKFTVER
ncbi:hypothetical protein B0H17DRAFT_1215648 [Mycena rosella]|uniref:Nephrocystin 3-like N-terminal domain-containing protein n=1 Tax=Mycena rosella TaxID=1033263 RepID=A0AAD7CH73_MYCRO|nr:hypothetical protein B0H17DRAFT_1215648 [Mycena rosella]